MASNDMTYEEFEWHILRMVYEEGVKRLSPSYISYALGLPHELVAHHLSQAVELGVVELSVSHSGSMEYVVPGLDASNPLPTPIWKRGLEPVKQPEPEPEPEPERPVVSGGRRHVEVSGEEALVAAVRGGMDGHVRGGRRGQERSQPGHGKKTSSPPALRPHVQEQQEFTDGTLYNVVQARDAVVDRRAVVARGVTVEDVSHAMVHAKGATLAAASTALVPVGAGAGGALLRVESNDETFCDPSQTIFMRQLRVHGVKSEGALREQIQRLFESFGYKTLNTTGERMRFERGSVTFILALVPLFVLILPLFIYLFFYCMGRSTIQQEPLELDVQIRRSGASESSYDIDLTFIGLHGIVLGAADQRVLNQEIDTLRDELRWALAAV